MPIGNRKEIQFYETHNGCWICCSHKTRIRGYATVFRKKPYLLHRYMYEKHVGKIPESMCVCHICDNPGCNNPTHLFLATQHENILDAKIKHRMASKEKSGKAKLTTEKVRNIRRSNEPYKVLAEKYGVSEYHIGDLRRGTCWAGVK